MAEPIPLGGVTYVHVGVSTLEHDIWFMAQLRKVGLTDPQIIEGEEPHDYAQRLLNQLLASGEAHLTVAGLIVPVGVRWSPAIAVQTAAHLGSLEDPEEKQRFWDFLLDLLGEFFQNGLGPWMTSRGYSVVRARVAEPKGKRSKNAARSTTRRGGN